MAMYNKGSRIIAALAALTITTSAAAMSMAETEDCQYCRGEEPSKASVEDLRGPLGWTTMQVTQANLAAATIYYPTGQSGTFGSIVVMPGLTAGQSNLAWLGPRLASNGFIAMVVDTPLLVEPDTIRAQYAKSALEQLVRLGADQSSALFGKVDPARLGAIGHSAGAGGIVQLGRDYPNLAKALIPLATNIQLNVQAMPPTMVMVCKDDPAVPADLHSRPVYEAIRAPKQLIIAQSGISDAHNCETQSNANEPKLGKYVISWMKLWLDRDRRYARFLCGAEGPLSDRSYVLEWQSNCPY